MMNAKDLLAKIADDQSASRKWNGTYCFLLESDIAHIIEQAQREVLEDVKPLLGALSDYTVGWMFRDRLQLDFRDKYAALLSDSEREGK